MKTNVFHDTRTQWEKGVEKHRGGGEQAARGAEAAAVRRRQWCGGGTQQHYVVCIRIRIRTEDYVTQCVELYVYVEVSARNFKVCCMTVKVIPKLTSDCVLPKAVA